MRNEWQAAESPVSKVILLDGERATAENVVFNAAVKCVSEAAFWNPERVEPPSGWTEHIPFAFWIVEASQPSVLVELGTHQGTSYAAFCQAVQTLGIGTNCFAVDTWEGDEHSGFYGNEVYGNLLDYNNRRFSDFSQLLRSRFDDALQYFKDGTIDLLHIDGCHSYSAVLHDFEQWLPKLSNRAVVLLHDTNVRERGFGVSRFWGEVKGRWPHFEFIHCHGLGVLGVGAELPEKVKALVSATERPEVQTAIRRIYARLGSTYKLIVIEKIRAQELGEQMRTQEQRFQAIEQELAAERRRQEQAAEDFAAERNREAQRFQAVAEAMSASEKAELQARRKLAAMKESGSWRITAALRRLEHLLCSEIGLFSGVKDEALILYWRLMTRIQVTPKARLMRSQAGRIAASGLLDAEWYRDHYERTPATHEDPALHYLLLGARRGFNPNASFDTKKYLKIHPEVDLTGANPVLHYLDSGADSDSIRGGDPMRRPVTRGTI